MDFLSYIRGYVKYEVKAEDKENLINIIRVSCPIRGISITDEILSFCCFFRDRKKVERILTEQRTEITQAKQKGVVPYICKHKKRHGLFAGVLIMAISMLVSSLFVWEIRIEGNECVADEEITRVLEQVGFREGKIKIGLDVKSLVNRYLIKEDRISWMAINMDGTVAHVEVREAKIWNTVHKKENVNLVAKHDGIIMRVDAVKGRAAVAKGDTVTKGQLLVSAFMDKRTGGEILKGAKGFVFAYTERAFEVNVPLEYNVFLPTGRKHSHNTVSFFGFEIPVSFEKTHKYESFTVNASEEKIKLSDKASLPVKIKNVCFAEQHIHKKRRTENEALQIAREIAKERLYELSPAFALADSDEEYSTEDGIVVYRVRFSGIEDIAAELEFELS